MPIPFIMPKMDMDQEEVFIDQWLKKEGEFIEKGEPVIIVETDKITSEVEAPASGKLARFLYQENETAPVTKPVAYILLEGETESDLPDFDKTPATQSLEEEKPNTLANRRPAAATALAMRNAKSEGIDLTDVPSSGEKITKEDIDAYLATKKRIHRVETPATPAARRIAVEQGVDLKKVIGTGPRNRVQAVDVTDAMKQKSHLEPLELSSMRRRIADRLTSSYQTIPHIYLTVEVDMARAELIRKQFNTKSSDEGQPNLSLTTFLVKILSDCLSRHPFLNASLENETILFCEHINIGVATALSEGLIVPVIHDANRLPIMKINQMIKNLSKKARDGQLTREEIQGGTFTISNLGMYGITSFTSIINPPQSAILSVGAIKRKPVVVDEEDSINVRPMMNLTLAADHRIVDGAVAANFLVDLVGSLENPTALKDLH